MAGAKVPGCSRCGNAAGKNNDNAKRNFVQHFYLLAKGDNMQMWWDLLWRNELSLICVYLSRFALICCNADLETARGNMQTASGITGM
jgi:hypothetical protein